MTHILHLDASARLNGSVSRESSARIVERLLELSPDATVTRRDLAGGEPHLTETWVGATFTPADARTDLQVQALSHSDILVAELEAADTIVIGMPVYNFGIPATLKTWMDHVARAGVTFRYTENGPEGLLKDKRVIIAFASGGVEQGAPLDFASPHIAHFFRFLGISEVRFELPLVAAA